MWPITFGVCGAVAGLGALVFTIRRDRRDTGEHRNRLRVEGQREDEKLSSFVVRQTEAVLHGWEGVNRELQERAEAVLRELVGVRLERDQLKAANEELRDRVVTLETKVATLEGQADVDRRTIHGLQQEIASLRSAS
jgi:chaperonin cofactor prefoldin